MGRGLEHELLVGILGHEQQLERSSLSVRWHLFFDLDQLRVLKVRDALAAIVLSAMVAAGCSSGDQAATRNTTTSTAGLPTATSPRATTAESATAPTNSSGRSAQSPSGLPLYDAIAHSLGYNLEVISDAVNRAQLDAIRKCLSDRGWSVNDTTMRGFEDSAQPDSGTIAYFIAVVNDPKPSSSDRDPIWDNAEFGVDAGECSANAYSDFTSPVADLFTLMKDVTKELSDRSRSDSRYIAAETEYGHCVAKFGYNTAEAANVSSSIAARGADLVNRYKRGAISHNVAVSELTTLQAQEHQANEMISECTSNLRAVEREVLADVQANYLTQNPGFVAALTQGAIESMRKYKKYLNK